jgi:hypothetical protein
VRYETLIVTVMMMYLLQRQLIVVMKNVRAFLFRVKNFSRNL